MVISVTFQSFTDECFLLSGCLSVLVAPVMPTVKRPVPLPPELQCLVKDLASPQQTERTVTRGVYHGLIFIFSFFFS